MPTKRVHIIPALSNCLIRQHKGLRIHLVATNTQYTSIKRLCSIEIYSNAYYRRYPPVHMQDTKLYALLDNTPYPNHPYN